MKVLVNCEFSGRVSAEFRALGHDAWSVDLLETEGDPKYHRVMDAVEAAYGEHWDLMIAHPTCTRLTNSGVRWLSIPPKEKTKEQMWAELEKACEFYRKLRDAPIEFKAVENPIMHKYASERIKPLNRQIVQPWWFGDACFKATGFELIGLQKLQPTNMLRPPALQSTINGQRFIGCRPAKTDG